ncbi:hypothetical protein [Bergeyella zoohelcum]|uniref:Uncharacterized protein n=2 Tax=Bergeyella zoohelcum TaxID=1015 RepID=K1LUN8_9FLAO|nr:hypothetical protein [Bergeyella zoohelcum]EKB58656.1 hypothetical protein HMPREF9699_00556 [Bergeyella zoohelcum ATCC 43767]SUV49254.1 Uncharacterised protein [Bergeyella zoohelcum]VDH03391.1 Uncharacterised protein [Bergeyella zoohelcum]
MKIKEKNKKILMELSKEESIVFFSWLNYFNENSENMFQDQSEQRILWDLESSLEKIILDVFSDDYNDKLKKYRELIRDKE